jgi:hypothetical protein
VWDLDIVDDDFRREWQITPNYRSRGAILNAQKGTGNLGAEQGILLVKNHRKADSANVLDSNTTFSLEISSVLIDNDDAWRQCLTCAGCNRKAGSV